MDRTVDATAAEQAFIGCIDDRVDRQCGDVTFDDFDAHHRAVDQPSEANHSSSEPSLTPSNRIVEK